MDLVRWPEDFDVIVASNLFADILSDIAAVVTGSMGLAPSANINPERRFPSMFEPVHGAAFDITGQSKANPLATIFAVAMMLDHFGETDRRGSGQRRRPPRPQRRRYPNRRPGRQRIDAAGG